MARGIGPTRSQKRWSGRLRTIGALLLLLGAVALVDHVVGRLGRSSSLEPIGRTRVPLAAIAPLLIVGGGAFWLGRRWR